MGFVVDELFDAVGGWDGRCTGFQFGGALGAVEQGGDDLKVEEHAAGADGVEVGGGDAAEDLGGDREGRGEVFDDGEFEGFVGVEVAEFPGPGFAGAGGVMEVAELLVVEGGGTALAGVGVDVAAADALEGDGDGFGGFGFGELRHVVPPLGWFSR